MSHISISGALYRPLVVHAKIIEKEKKKKSADATADATAENNTEDQSLSLISGNHPIPIPNCHSFEPSSHIHHLKPHHLHPRGSFTDSNVDMLAHLKKRLNSIENDDDELESNAADCDDKSTRAESLASSYSHWGQQYFHPIQGGQSSQASLHTCDIFQPSFHGSSNASLASNDLPWPNGKL